jgi:hypothetical protein
LFKFTQRSVNIFLTKQNFFKNVKFTNIKQFLMQFDAILFY